MGNLCKPNVFAGRAGGNHGRPAFPRRALRGKVTPYSKTFKPFVKNQQFWPPTKLLICWRGAAVAGRALSGVQEIIQTHWKNKRFQQAGMLPPVWHRPALPHPGIWEFGGKHSVKVIPRRVIGHGRRYLSQSELVCTAASPPLQCALTTRALVHARLCTRGCARGVVHARFCGLRNR